MKRKAVLAVLTVCVLAIVVAAVGTDASSQEDEVSGKSPSGKRPLRGHEERPEIRRELDRLLEESNSRASREALLARILAETETLNASWKDGVDFTRFLIRQPEEGLGRLFRGWFQSDWEGAFQALETIDSPRLRLNALRAGFGEAIHAPDAFWAEAHGALDESSRKSFQSSFLVHLAEHAPRAGAELLQKVKQGERNDLMSAFARSLVAKNPAEAALMGAAVTDNDLRKSIFESFSSLGPTVDLETLAKVPFSGLSEDEYNTLVSSVASHQIARRSPAEINKMFAEKVEFRQHTQQFVRVWASERPTQLVEAFQEGLIDDLVDLERDAPEIVDGLANHLRLAESFFDTLPADLPSRPSSAGRLAKWLVHEDATRAARWISSLELGPARDAALLPLFDYLKRHRAEESLREYQRLHTNPESLTSSAP